MASNNRNPGEVILSMAELEQFDFFKEQRYKFESAWREVASLNLTMQYSLTAKPLIQRVPLALIALKVDFEKYFEPRMVAFGPLHHGNPKFRRAEQAKLKFAVLFALENETTDSILFHKIKAEIEDLRRCYNPEDIRDYDDDTLAWMFFVDGCAVLYVMHYGLRGEFKRLNIQADLLVYFHHDLMLLENQLPYRVLKVLFSSALDPQKWEQTITDHIYSMANRMIEKKSQHWGNENEQDCVHLLERLRRQLLIGQAEQSRCSVIGKMLLWCGDCAKDHKTVTSIMDLKDSGIRVRPSKTSNLRGISFYCNFPGTITMPPLWVDDSTPSIFMNLVALESCPDFNNNHLVSTYLWFLRSLIQTAEDIKELRVRGVLHNYYGTDEEVADLFRRMSRDLLPDQEIYSAVTENMQRYCNSWLIKTYSNYFGANWSFLAFLGVIIGLSLTLLQTYFTIYPNK